LAESLRVAHQSGALPTRDLARVTIDTTVQPKAISFPTDAKLLYAAIKGADYRDAKLAERGSSPESLDKSGLQVGPGLWCAHQPGRNVAD
jgi:hypothetical protein